MAEKILVPLDGSNAAEIVIPYVEEIATKLSAEIIVVSVYESSDDMSHLHSYYLERVVEQMQRQLKEFEPGVELKIQSDVLQGKPAHELLHYADEADVSLIAMASYGSSGREPKLLGNIATKVIRSSSKPVLLIRAPASDADLQGRRLIKKILVPLDGSKIGETIIEYIEVLAKGLGAELLLFQVLEPLRIVAGFETVAPYTIPQGEESIKASAITYLNSIQKSLREKSIKTSTAIVWGSAAERIIEYADTNTIDLIAMSSHGLSGVGRWVLGSVTEKVLQAGDKPVLIVRPAKS